MNNDSNLNIIIPKISIIVPVYNTQDTLRGAINSILAQTYNNYEVIIVDDGSTDQSAEICDEFSKIDKRIQIIHQKNGGLSDARNTGIKAARGDNFLFIDSDDKIHEKFCEILLSVKEAENCDIVSSDMYYASDHNDIFSVQTGNISCSFYSDSEILREYFCPTKERKIYHGICMKLYDRKLFKDLWFEKGRLHEDLFLTYKLLDRAKRFAYVELPMYFYYQNPSSITHIYQSKNFIDEYDAVQGMINYFKGRNDIDEYLKKFIIVHYVYLITRSTELKGKPEIEEKKREMTDWIENNVWNVKLINKVYAFIYILCCRFPGLYNHLLNLKHLF